MKLTNLYTGKIFVFLDEPQVKINMELEIGHSIKVPYLKNFKSIIKIYYDAFN